MLVLLPLHRLGTKHPWEEFGIVANALEFTIDLFLILLRLFKLWNVVAFVLAGLFLDFFEAFLHLILI